MKQQILAWFLAHGAWGINPIDILLFLAIWSFQCSHRLTSIYFNSFSLFILTSNKYNWSLSLYLYKFIWYDLFRIEWNITVVNFRIIIWLILVKALNSLNMFWELNQFILATFKLHFASIACFFHWCT